LTALLPTPAASQSRFPYPELRLIPPKKQVSFCLQGAGRNAKPSTDNITALVCLFKEYAL